MQTLIQNPATDLRGRLSSLSPKGFIRWDLSGKALLISDAPRRESPESLLAAFSSEDTGAWVENGLFYLDLSPKAYEALLAFPHSFSVSPLSPALWQEQLLLQRILSHPVSDCFLDIPLLRRGLLSTVLPSADFHLFLKELRSAYAKGLRKSSLASCRACARLCWARLLAEGTR